MKNKMWVKIKFSLAFMFLLLQFSNCSPVTATSLEDQSSTNLSDNNIPNTSNTDDQTIVNTFSNSKIAKANFYPNDGKVDIVLVIDDSYSMQADSMHLASRLEGFVNSLEHSLIDWQMCLITTNFNVRNGESINWVSNTTTEQWILKKGVTNLASIFNETIAKIEFGSAGSKDERAIASLKAHLDKKEINHCYRSNAAVSTIIISDEDERSVGGVKELFPSQYLALEEIDSPLLYLNSIKSSLSTAQNPLRISSNSIIIKSNDKYCLDLQNEQGTVGFVGTKYAMLSELTNGKIGSICDTDYTVALKEFAEQIKKSLYSISLECIPKEPIEIIFSKNLSTSQLNGSTGAEIKYHIENQTVIIDSPITQPMSAEVKYQCKI